LKDVGKTRMKRPVMMAILKMCGKAIFLTSFVGIVLVIIGTLNKWDTSLKYANAFFIAGSLLIIAGGMSRLVAGQEWHLFQWLNAESFRDMSASERANFIVNASSSVSLLILGLLSGLSLILISAIVTKLF
jgi:hypothetical protein